MEIKLQNYTRTTLNRFDLLGHGEPGLAKAFAYVLSSERALLFAFLRSLGVSAKDTDRNLREIVVETERRRNEGRTDIEIRLPGRFHVIVECKVGTNRLKSQRAQYIPSFEDAPATRVLCFITEERDYNRAKTTGVEVHYRGWSDILDLVDHERFKDLLLAREFASFTAKGFNVRRQREVLIQDLSNPDEIARYVKNQIYRRDVTFGSPLYFAPYFTRNSLAQNGAPQDVGISFLSRVLGVLTVKGQDVDSFADELRNFARGHVSSPDQQDLLVEKWLSGVDRKSKVEYTHYFLADPVTVAPPLRKDGGVKKGRGKNWIAGKIPKNRCVTFAEFTRRMVMAANAD